jgi:hypothetical protein
MMNPPLIYDSTDFSGRSLWESRWRFRLLAALVRFLSSQINERHVLASFQYVEQPTSST